MITFLLIRHGLNDFVGNTLAGWSPGVHLNETGRQQAEQLAARLASVPVHAIYSSPLDRALETAAPLAESKGIRIQVCNDFGEFRYGEWTGRKLEEMEDVPGWKQFNTFRTGTRAPGGELMTEVQARMVVALEHVREAHPDEVVDIFSHGDAIRAALAHYMGVALDMCLRLVVSPASVSVVKVDDWGPQILRINDTGEILG